MNPKQKKLKATYFQWIEIYNKLMQMSPDLRDFKAIQEAHLMMISIDKMIFEARTESEFYSESSMFDQTKQA